jgi:outer membrane lipoprotein LolB
MWTAQASGLGEFAFCSRVGAARIACVALAAFELAACTTTPSAPETATRDAIDLRDWQASGRIAVSGTAAGGSGSFVWSQQGGEATVQMRGPVGIGGLRLTLTEQSLRVATADGQEFVAEEAEAELAARLGASVPAQDLRYWLVGVAAPGEHQWSKAVDTATLTQHDWRIDYQRFGVTSGVRLPLKLVAVSGPAKVRIVIDKWKVK